MLGTFLASIATVSLASAYPTALQPRASSTGCQNPYGASGDAPFTVPCATMQAAITCPKGVGKSAGGTVFLVHGTGSTGAESWQNGPYNVFLPTAGPGYDICWVDLPGRSLVDAQVSAEYVAYGIGYLAKTSTTRKVSIIGHSQGAGINPQWALLWWPSTRSKTAAYIALAGDFRGTAEGPLLCDGQKLTVQGGCEPSVWQQSVGAAYLKAQNTKGNQQLVPTTSLYTHYDDVIQPEYNSAIATSNLPGAAVFAMQDLDICGPGHVADHFLMIVDPAAYALALDALTHGGHASASRFNKIACTYFQNNVLISRFMSIPALLISSFNDIVVIGSDNTGTKAEPPLMQYVCDAGVAPESACVSSAANSSPIDLLANSAAGLITGMPFVPGYKV